MKSPLPSVLLRTCSLHKSLSEVKWLLHCVLIVFIAPDASGRHCWKDSTSEVVCDSQIQPKLSRTATTAIRISFIEHSLNVLFDIARIRLILQVNILITLTLHLNNETVCDFQFQQSSWPLSRISHEYALNVVRHSDNLVKSSWSATEPD